eukprot:snap_masked-scaffold_56-processed-gene-0.15-mRNA-1 protein AED:1.00 eAED:1.00 QI:0/-1/0/0/-1/1/1/0/195
MSCCTLESVTHYPYWKGFLLCDPFPLENSPESNDVEGASIYPRSVLRIIISFLQGIALIVFKGVLFPEFWESSVKWVKLTFLPNINLTDVDNATLYFAVYGFIFLLIRLTYVAAGSEEVTNRYIVPSDFQLSKKSMDFTGISLTAGLVLFGLETEVYKLFGVLVLYLGLYVGIQFLRHYLREKKCAKTNETGSLR